jgi:hypothetical protein
VDILKPLSRKVQARLQAAGSKPPRLYNLAISVARCPYPAQS